MSNTLQVPLLTFFATVQEGAAEAGQGREEELVARVRYIREVEARNQRGWLLRQQIREVEATNQRG